MKKVYYLEDEKKGIHIRFPSLVSLLELKEALEWHVLTKSGLLQVVNEWPVDPSIQNCIAPGLALLPLL